MLPHRLTTLFVAFALLATACTGGDDSDAMETAAVESTTQVAVDEPSTEPPVDLRGAFTAAGVTIVDDPASAPVMSGIQVSTWQLETMEFELERGGGYVGSQLDGVTGAPGGLPISYLLAGWMESGVTANAEAAADLWPLILLTFLLLINISEAVVLKQHNLFWVLYVAVLASPRAASAERFVSQGGTRARGTASPSGQDMPRVPFGRGQVSPGVRTAYRRRDRHG